MYDAFIKGKPKTITKSGFEAVDINKNLFPFQVWIVKRALLYGRFAVFADCGLGKTIMQLEWAAQIVKQTGGKVLILAPLEVTDQTKEEAIKFDISLEGITITNYEQIDNLNLSDYIGVCLDESSIIKNYSGATKDRIVKGFETTPYKLASSGAPPRLAPSPVAAAESERPLRAREPVPGPSAAEPVLFACAGSSARRRPGPRRRRRGRSWPRGGGGGGGRGARGGRGGGAGGGARGCARAGR